MKIRLLKIVFAVAIIFIVMMNGCVVASACKYNTVEGKDVSEVENDPAYWWQGRVPAFNEPITAGNSSVGNAACSSFAMTYCLVKMGIYHVQDGDGPVKLIQEAREKGLYSNGWYFDYKKIDSLYPDIECINDFDYGVAGKSSNEAIDYIKGLMAEGKYVIACVNGPQGGHMIFFDGIDESGNLLIGDSAFAGLDWNTTYGNMGATLQYAVVFEYSEPSTDMPSIYDGVDLRKDKKKDEKDIERKNILVKEWDLVGMPAKSALVDRMGMMTLYDYNSALADYEKASLAVIQENMRGDKISLIRVVGLCLSIFGLLLIVYAVLLILAFFLDRFFFLDISVVGLLTMGNIKIIDDKYKSEFDKGATDRGYFTNKKFFVVVIVVISLGIFLISGVALKYILSAMEVFM